MDQYRPPENNWDSDGMARITNESFVRLCKTAEFALYHTESGSPEQYTHLIDYGTAIREEFGDFHTNTVRISGFGVSTESDGIIDKNSVLHLIDAETTMIDICPKEYGEVWPTLICLERPPSDDDSDEGGYDYIDVRNVLQFELLPKSDKKDDTLQAFLSNQSDSIQKIIGSSVFLNGDIRGQQSMLDQLTNDLEGFLSECGIDPNIEFVVPANYYYAFPTDMYIDLALARVDWKNEYYTRPTGAYNGCVFADAKQTPDKHYKTPDDFTFDHGNPCVILINDSNGYTYFVPILEIIDIFKP